MTDVFVLMQLPNAGDDLQAIKKGVVELADLVVVNKPDLDPAAADRAMAQIAGALRAAAAPRRSELAAAGAGAERADRGTGIERSGPTRRGAAATRSRRRRRARGERERQALAWTWHLIDAGLRERFRSDPRCAAALPRAAPTSRRRTLRTPAAAAARRLVGAER